ncbi:MAG: sigma 54-interacting transcriptional regulator [Planctomycetes bacterium]|nr:sigma 54-interacting transcriptional regulator [Planctomycetota bacterium]
METELQGASMFRLVILGDGSVRTVPLHGERWVVGRAPDCEISLRDPTVSRRHVLLERTGSSIHLKDLGGRNPVLVDCKPRSEAELAAGQTISIGMTRLVLESRGEPRAIESSTETVLITGREVIDEEITEPGGESMAAHAQKILERIEWTFAELGSLSDAADPLLALALNLTGRQRGLIGRFLTSGGLETLATLDTVDRESNFVVPETLLHESRRLNQVSVLTTAHSDASQSRVLIPLGNGPEAILLLESPTANAPEGQQLLRLCKVIGQVIWHRLLEVRERLRLRDEVERLRYHGSSSHNAVLTSTRLQGARQNLRELANADGCLLLIGEEGTEREDLARYIHAEGNRRRHAFASLHLGLIPEWRLEKELFGVDGISGAFGKARGGTLFLDSIGQLPFLQQEKLHTLITATQEGSSLPPPRIVASAEEGPDLGSGAWFGPLAEELNAHVIAIPPLRDEQADILALAELFLSDMGSGPDGGPRLLSERTKRILAGYHWPGNVRQLRLVLETAAAQAGNQQITPRHLPPEIQDCGATPTANSLSLEEIERQHIRHVLKQLGGNRARTAQALGIANSTLYDKLRRFGIEG